MKKILLLLLIICTRQIHGQIITTVAGNGTQGFSGDGGQATLAELNQPLGIKVDSVGNIYIAEGGDGSVRKVDTSGIITTIAGNGIRGYSGDGGLAINAQLTEPSGLAFDAFGNLFIADEGNNTIRKINTSGIISTIAGNGTWGYSGDGGLAINALLANPFDLAFDRVGNLYISDSENSVIRKIDTNGIITTFAGNGSQTTSGDGGLATNAGLGYTFEMAFDTIGNLYFSTGWNARIRMIDTGGIISSYYTGYSSMGFAKDLKGNLYVAIMQHDFIQKRDTSGIYSDFAGNYINGYSGDGGAATNAEINGPLCITIDLMGNFYFSDANNTIRKVSYCNTPLTINITGLDTVCGGSNIILTASGANTYSWSANAGSTSTNTVIVNPTTNSTYSVYGISGECIASDKDTLVVNPQPYISSLACSGGTATLTVSGASSYAWSANAGSATTNSVTVNLIGNTSYTVIGTDTSGCIGSYSFVLYNSCNITGVPKILETKDPVKIYPNPTSDQFFIDANTTDKLNVDLYDVNGRHVFSASVSSKENINVAILDNGAYTLTIKTADRVINKKLVILR